MKKLAHPIFLVLVITLPLSNVQAESQESQLKNSNWVTKTSITIAMREDQAYVQNGKVIEGDMSDDAKNYPYCAIRSNKSFDAALTIAANSVFTITDVDYLSESVDIYNVMYRTRMKVKSDKYPSITSIDCGVIGDKDSNYVTMDDITTNTKGVMSLQPK